MVIFRNVIHLKLGPVELNNTFGTSARISVLFNDNEAYGEK